MCCTVQPSVFGAVGVPVSELVGEAPGAESVGAGELDGADTAGNPEGAPAKGPAPATVVCKHPASKPIAAVSPTTVAVTRHRDAGRSDIGSPLGTRALPSRLSHPRRGITLIDAMRTRG